MTNYKGLEVSREEFEAILKDIEWQSLLVFDNKGNVFIDIKKYSELKHYLPIESEYQSYLVGFSFYRKLYECPYRTQNDLVCIYPPREKQIFHEIVKERIPLFKTDVGYSSGNAECMYDDRKYIEREKIVRVEE